MNYKDYVDIVHTKIRESHPELTRGVTKAMVKTILYNFNRHIAYFIKRRCYVNLSYLIIYPNPYKLLKMRRRKYAIGKAKAIEKEQSLTNDKNN